MKASFYCSQFNRRHIMLLVIALRIVLIHSAITNPYYNKIGNLTSYYMNVLMEGLAALR